MDLLNSRCWLEGFCHSLAAATMADCAIGIEEAGLEDPQACHDVPASNRIRFVRTSRLTGVFSPPEYHKKASMCGQELHYPARSPRTRVPAATSAPSSAPRESALGLDVCGRGDAGGSAVLRSNEPKPAAPTGRDVLAESRHEPTAVRAN